MELKWSIHPDNVDGIPPWNVRLERMWSHSCYILPGKMSPILFSLLTVLYRKEGFPVLTADVENLYMVGAR